MIDTLTPEEHLALNTTKGHRLRSYRRIVYGVLALAAASEIFVIAVWASLSADGAISVRGLL